MRAQEYPIYLGMHTYIICAFSVCITNFNTAVYAAYAKLFAWCNYRIIY